jgi:hypothetical protein
MWANVVEPTLSLLSGDDRLESVERAFLDALRELKPESARGTETRRGSQEPQCLSEARLNGRKREEREPNPQVHFTAGAVRLHTKIVS